MHGKVSTKGKLMLATLTAEQGASDKTEMGCPPLARWR